MSGAYSRHWRAMLAVNAAVMLGVFLHKLALPPYIPYIHLLVDYHFGFIKRALIGAVVGLFTAKVPVWLVFALAGGVWLITFGLFVQLFRRTFGLGQPQLPLFIFTAGSPFVFKNFLFTLGHFDIYGCLGAIVLLLVPARSLAYVLLAALISAALVLIHHIHLLMYVPTVAAIVVLRYYLIRPIMRLDIAVGAIALLGLGALFFAAQFLGTMPLPEADFVSYLKTRMVDPSRTELLQFAYVWYQPLSKEVQDTWARLPSNLLGVPVYALLLWLHRPLWRVFKQHIHSLNSPRHRQIVIAALIVIGLAYLVMFAMVFDYSRWISSWMVCMVLMLHAVKTLPATKSVAPIDGDDRKTTILGWIITVLPRVGIIRPF
ncbi:conserved membrane protein of unknown function [Bradyrhizobium sp. ORS 285]|uniref:hypothetical protein n=1 Tax=Bradyrhizobium sp. ORS 285 TaxID=115808 RepID=UPI00024078F2|nr:hypothetical protein [Bradyrhizobium sp. ORS 285]CCD87327.1 conserved membrane hypothetical protein [Bradyrhizobium sp. ORS 285]SMX62075.1 conserved membrane protein of unknown function [Bradyrhizobium sp. ORS 285]